MKANLFQSNRLLKWMLYLVLVFLFQELVLRICFPVPEIRNLDRVDYLNPLESGRPYSRNTIRYWQSEPDTNAIFDHLMNRYGFRDGEWSMDKKPGQKRMLFIGDSFIEGVMATQEETIPQGFRQAFGAGEVEAMNAGVLGKGLNAYLMVLSDLMPLYKPDVVFFCIYANDLGSKTPIVPDYYLKPDFFPWYVPRFYTVIQEAKLRGPLLPIWHQQREGYLPSVETLENPWRLKEKLLKPHVTSELAEMMKKGTFNPFCIDGLAKMENFLCLSPKLGETLPYLRYVCQQNQAQAVVVYLPCRNQVSNAYLPFEKEVCLLNCPDSLDLTVARYQVHQQELKRQCQLLGLPLVDLTPVVRAEEAKGRRLYWNYDEHMKGFAYLEMGEAIAEAYKEM